VKRNWLRGNGWKDGGVNTWTVDRGPRISTDWPPPTGSPGGLSIRRDVSGTAGSAEVATATTPATAIAPQASHLLSV
jgi:hypothetical protein